MRLESPQNPGKKKAMKAAKPKKGLNPNLTEDEKKKLINRIRTLLNDYSGPYRASLGGINFTASLTCIKDFFDDIQKADSPEAERKVLEKLAKRHDKVKKKEEISLPSPRDMTRCR